MAEQFAGFGEAGEYRFGHPVVQQAGNGLPFIGCQGAIVLGDDMEGDDALDALDGWRQIAVPGNVGGLGRPRRNGADTRRNEEQFAGFGAGGLLFQQRRQLGALVGIQGTLLRHDMPIISDHGFDIRHGRHQAGLQALQTEGGKGGVALEAKNVGHGEVISG